MQHIRAAGNRLTVGVVRVFTTKAGTYGNPLGIVDGARVPAEERQSVAAINRRPDSTPTTSRIDVPATVIHGTDDSVFPLGFGRRLAGLIAGADFVEVEGAGHAPDGAARAGDGSDPRPGGESDRRRSIALP